jgi:ATP synthase protein I
MEDLDARRDALAKALQAKSDEGKRKSAALEIKQEGDMAKATRYSTDFISGPIVGGIMGYACDSTFNSSPWGILIFLLLGFAAGIFNLIRSSRKDNG